MVELLDGTLILHSETLVLELRVKGREMYFLHPVTGRRLLSHQEENAAHPAAESRAEQEMSARQRPNPAPSLPRYGSRRPNRSLVGGAEGFLHWFLAEIGAR